MTIRKRNLLLNAAKKNEILPESFRFTIKGLQSIVKQSSKLKGVQEIHQTAQNILWDIAINLPR